MSKSLQVFVIFLIIFMLVMPSFVQATQVNMNLAAENNSSEDSDAVSEENNSTSDNLSPSTTNYSNNSSTVSSLNQLPEAGLGLTNILNIILIVIGILLILLGIAILIRLKQ